MDSNLRRKNAVITGILFIVGTVAALAAAPFEAVLSGKDYLTKVDANASQVATGALFYLIAAFTSVGIAVSLYPVLKRWHVGLAIGAVIFRTIEAVMYIVAVVSLLSLVTLSQHFVNAGATDFAASSAIGDMLRSMREHATLAGVFSFSLGAFMYYYLFFQARLLPRWLAGWGIVASILMLVACVLALFSGSYVTGYVLLILPIAIQEMVLAVWLIVKGFNLPAIAADSAKTGIETNELLSLA